MVKLQTSMAAQLMGQLHFDTVTEGLLESRSKRLPWATRGRGGPGRVGRRGPSRATLPGAIRDPWATCVRGIPVPGAVSCPLLLGSGRVPPWTQAPMPAPPFTLVHAVYLTFYLFIDSRLVCILAFGLISRAEIVS